jgi:hypothetical protein
MANNPNRENTTHRVDSSVCQKFGICFRSAEKSNTNVVRQVFYVATTNQARGKVELSH